MLEKGKYLQQNSRSWGDISAILSIFYRICISVSRQFAIIPFEKDEGLLLAIIDRQGYHVDISVIFPILLD